MFGMSTAMTRVRVLIRLNTEPEPSDTSTMIFQVCEGIKHRAIGNSITTKTSWSTDDEQFVAGLSSFPAIRLQMLPDWPYLDLMDKRWVIV